MALKDAHIKITREGILFVLGVAGFMYEIIVNGLDRPIILGIFASMAGLPFASFMEGRKQGNGSGTGTQGNSDKS